MVGFLLLITSILFVVSLAMIMRGYRKGANPNELSENDCMQALASIHQEEIGDMCKKGKYLGSNRQCRKTDMSSWWEEDNSIRTLNPQSCEAAQAIYFRPIFTFGYLAFLAVGMIGIMAICAFYLADHSQYMEIHYKKTNFVEIGFLILTLIFLSFAIIYLLFFAGNYSLIQQKPWSGASYETKNGLPPSSSTSDNFDKFEIVPKQLFQQENQYAYTSSDGDKANPTLKSTSNCSGQKCGFRVGALATNASISRSSRNATWGSENARNIFFETCTSKFDDFVFIFGTTPDVNKALQQLTFKPIEQKDVHVYYYIQEIDLAKLNENGLKSTEQLITPTKLNVPSCKPSGYTEASNCGKSVCKVTQTFKNQVREVNITGKLLVRNEETKKYEKYPNVQDLQLYFHRDGQPSIKGDINDTDATYSIKVPVYRLVQYKGTMDFKDNKNQYLSNQIDISVPADYSEDINGGSVYFFTKDGTGCIQKPAAQQADCYNNMVQGRGDVKVSVYDAQVHNAIGNAHVQLINKFTQTGTVLKDSTSDPQTGLRNFIDIPYGYYILKVTKPNYQTKSIQIYHFEANTKEMVFLIPDTVADAPVSLSLDITNAKFDEDIFVQMKTNKGAECEVSPYNKYCGYMSYNGDVVKGASGSEIVTIDKPVVAKYLYLVKTNKQQPPLTSMSCPESQVANVHYFSLPEQKPFWEQFKSAKINKKMIGREEKGYSSHLETIKNNGSSAPPENYWVVACFTGFGQQSMHYINQIISKRPTIDSACDPLFPKGSKYAVDTLQKKVDEINKSN